MSVASVLLEPALEGNAPWGEAFWAALHNYWVDSCYVAIAGLAMFGKECAHASLAAELLKALLWEEAPKEGGLAKTQSLRTIGEWLFALLRRHRVPYSRLSGIVEKIAESAREPAIAGRMYRRIGMSTQWVGNDGFLVTLLLLPTSGSFIEGEDANVIASWIRAEPYEAHKFLRHLGELLERLEGAEFERIYKGELWLRKLAKRMI